MRNAHEQTFLSHDGQAIFYRHWRGANPGDKAVLLLHRGHEHSGRLQHIVDELGLEENISYFAWDARGHGRTEGERGYAEDFGVLVRDLECFVQHIEREYGLKRENIIVVAQSVGAVIASTWVHDYAPRIRGLALASPAFNVKLYVPLAVLGLRLALAARKKFFVNSYVKSRFLTHDPVRQASYDADPLITRAISVNILLELYEVSERLVRDAGAITVPTLLLSSGADFVVKREPQLEFFRGLGSAYKEFHNLSGFYHDTLGEVERERAFAPLRTFIARCFSGPMWNATRLLRADKSGHTFDEYRALQAPLPLTHPKRISFGATRLVLSTLGRFVSGGIRTGVETGFDSGTMLDYVYRNEAKGAGAVGRLVDRVYLDAIGWRGIRQRGKNLVSLLSTAISTVHAREEAVQLVDVAAGHGRYVLEAVQTAGVEADDRILLRDYSELNVEKGAMLIRQKGLEKVARFARGDAFDRADLSALTPRPNIAVVSGLYELFPDNDKVQASLAGLHSAMKDGGILVYTNQPWHPQLEFIARVLTSHRQGADWVMRRRTQLEMDELVRAAGFEKLDQISDRWGIFTVSLAVKKA
jgi:alpha-beta hydrolase superfamily lysophospholipase